MLSATDDSRSKIAFNDANNTVASFDLGTLIRIAAEKTVCTVTHTVIQSNVYSVDRAFETSLNADGVLWTDRDGPSENGFAVVVGDCDLNILGTIVVIPEYQTLTTNPTCIRVS
ncbi:hypothetical protein DJ68_13185 [Halorubrum sp. C3]|nr:hypothetical protein DJ68_13185 [Halorubrum sp. C3]